MKTNITGDFQIYICVPLKVWKGLWIYKRDQSIAGDWCESQKIVSVDNRRQNLGYEIKKTSKTRQGEKTLKTLEHTERNQ